MKKGAKIALVAVAAVFAAAGIAFGGYWHHNMHWYDEYEENLKKVGAVEKQYTLPNGRVIAVERHRGLGSRILKEGIKAAKDVFGADKIYVEAQTYVKGLYEKQGFQPVSAEFLLDGIPHVRMILELEESE